MNQTTTHTNNGVTFTVSSSGFFVGGYYNSDCTWVRNHGKSSSCSELPTQTPAWGFCASCAHKHLGDPKEG